jgi:hypothetical protein
VYGWGGWQVNAIVPDDGLTGIVPLVLALNDSFRTPPVYISVGP